MHSYSAHGSEPQGRQCERCGAKRHLGCRITFTVCKLVARNPRICTGLVRTLLERLVQVLQAEDAVPLVVEVGPAEASDGEALQGAHHARAALGEPPAQRAQAPGCAHMQDKGGSASEAQLDGTWVSRRASTSTHQSAPCGGSPKWMPLHLIWHLSLANSPPTYHHTLLPPLRQALHPPEDLVSHIAVHVEDCPIASVCKVHIPAENEACGPANTQQQAHKARPNA